VLSHIVPASRVGAIAVRTQPYVGASAGVGGGYHALAASRSPSLVAAHVPINGLPAQRSFPDRRATAFSRTEALSVRGGGGRSRPALPERAGVSSYLGYRSAYPSTFGASSGYVTSPGYRSVPSYGGRAFASPSGSMSRSFAPSPAFRGGSSFRSGGSSFHSAPSFHGGGGGARHR